jgi:hypothetical protein
MQTLLVVVLTIHSSLQKMRNWHALTHAAPSRKPVHGKSREIAMANRIELKRLGGSFNSSFGESEGELRSISDPTSRLKPGPRLKPNREAQATAGLIDSDADFDAATAPRKRYLMHQASSRVLLHAWGI